MSATGPSPKTKRTRDPERTRAALLLAARSEFMEHGFNGARTSTIAKQAGVPSGLIYHYFENKQTLYQAVMEGSLAPYFENLHELLEGATSPDLQLLESSIRMYFEFLQDNPHAARLMAWWHADEGWRRGAPIKEAELCADTQSLGLQRIREAQAAGCIKPHLDPGFVVKVFVDLCMQWHVSVGEHVAAHGGDPDHAPSVRALGERYIDHVIEIFMSGVRADSAPTPPPSNSSEEKLS